MFISEQQLYIGFYFCYDDLKKKTKFAEKFDL